jgi:hypothetical protein
MIKSPATVMMQNSLILTYQQREGDLGEQVCLLLAVEAHQLSMTGGACHLQEEKHNQSSKELYTVHVTIA